MLNFSLRAGAAALLLATTAAQADTEQRDLRDFDAIEVGRGVDLELTQGAEFSVVVETSDGDLSDIVTEVRNGTLRISLEHAWYDRDNWYTDYNAVITLPVLTELEASGGSDVFTTGTFTGDELEFEVSGGSDLEADVAVNILDVTASGGADVELSGTANMASAHASGGSDVDAQDLVAKAADLRATGGSDLTMSVSDSLDASASGGSDIDYYGDPQVRDTDESGGSDITRH